MQIIKAELQHVPDLIPLFDGYRIFYEQESDYVRAKSFLTKRLKRNESIIYIAYDEENAVGFTQLYPLFSSVTMQPMFLLNDLYVEDNYRNQGIGNMLIDKAKQLCKTLNYKGLAIQTAQDNPAQHLYERLGFVKDTDLHLFWINKID
ncbi:MAG: GNAT family N-acetyltransferase [Flavobacteriaceae bacterium]|nr:GNAT family N-acetyltransferase [Flavobacteriaceae bacterium]